VTINLTDVTFDLLVAEQLHDIVPCDSTKHTRTAHWTITCVKCSLVSVACDPCRDYYDAEPSRQDIFCMRCNTVWPTPTPWVAL